MILIWYVLFILGILFLSINVYLWFLGCASFLPERKRARGGAPRTRFAIIVPAHDESKVIERTMKSLGEIDYPGELHEIVVIADNCTDDTARIARACGATVFEREDDANRGKGFALDWVFKKLEKNPFEAAVIVDADTIVAPDFLTHCDVRVQAGEQAIQGYYDVIDPEGSPMSSLSYLGFVLNRNLRYTGRTRLGGSSNLLGNGMCFTRAITDKYGWPASSVVEDLEFEIILNLDGIPVSFAPEARIFAEMPETFEQSTTQRSRWDLGKFQIRNKYVPRLLMRAISRFSVNCFDRAIELCIPPYSILWGFSFLLFVGSLAFSFMYGFDELFAVWAAGLGASIAYVFLGLIVAKASWRIYRNLLYAPFFIIWRMNIILKGSVSKATEKWIKTER